MIKEFKFSIILTPVKYSQFFIQNIQNSTLEIIRNAGHMVMIEKPLELNELINQFLENL